VLDGGSITPVGDSSTALFSSTSTGTFRVVGRGKGKKLGQGGTGGSTDTTTTQPVDTVTVVVTPPPSPIVSVSLSPSSASVVMNTIQVFTASGTREDGTSANPIVTWSTTGGGTLNEVESAAEYKAGSTKGTWQVSATLDGGSASALASVQVTDVWIQEDFRQYASTAELLSTSSTVYSTGEDLNRGRIFLDQTKGVNGLTQSMRYDQPDRTGDTTNRCHDYTIGRKIPLPAQVSEVWLEAWVQFSVGFKTVAPSEWGCTSNPEQKFLMLSVYGQSGRFGFNVGQAVGQRFYIHSPDGSATDGTTSGLYPMTNVPIFTDGKWHRYRLYAKINTNGQVNGAVKGWLDDSLLIDRTGLDVTASSIYAIMLGRNINQGPAGAQSIWWGSVRAWRTNPGW
jgi:hypothetical protein